MSSKLLIFISGKGTNLLAIIAASTNKLINANVIGVISNRKDAYGLKIAQEHHIPTYYKPYLKSMDRTLYDKELALFVNTLDYDLIVLAGWMHLLSNNFLLLIKKPIINLHPALPGQFAGKDAIKDAFEAYQNKKIRYTGAMIHYVIEKMDAGQVIDKVAIPIFENDTENSLRERVQYFEKPLLINSINKVLNMPELIANKQCRIYSGKVREIYDFHDNILMIKTSNRQSAFDRYICDIPNKGIILTYLSSWWFKKTEHLIDNHYLYHYDNVMMVKKCQPIKLEIVVRGYITGNTKTSLWMNYSNSIHNYCGHKLEDNLVKNQKLKTNIVTPTTKGETDELISGDEIIEKKILTPTEWKYIENISLKLFEYGQYVANKKGLILVDTKYEFGKDEDGQIILIDELHTCDSSRYWLKSTYQERFDKGIEPEKFDKDIIRDWIAKNYDPYGGKTFTIPDQLIENVSDQYLKFSKFFIKK